MSSSMPMLLLYFSSTSFLINVCAPNNEKVRKVPNDFTNLLYTKLDLLSSRFDEKF